MTKEYRSVSEEKAAPDNGYYVSQEMLDGYLSYSRKTVNQITGGISLFILSNVFESFGCHYMILSFLYQLTMIAGIILIMWYFFQPRQYREIKTERLIFDDTVLGTFKKQRETRTRLL